MLKEEIKKNQIKKDKKPTRANFSNTWHGYETMITL